MSTVLLVIFLAVPPKCLPQAFKYQWQKVLRDKDWERKCFSEVSGASLKHGDARQQLALSLLSQHWVWDVRLTAIHSASLLETAASSNYPQLSSSHVPIVAFLIRGACYYAGKNQTLQFTAEIMCDPSWFCKCMKCFSSEKCVDCIYGSLASLHTIYFIL